MTAPSHLETLESIKYTRGHLSLLDQRQLPHKTVYDDVTTVEQIWTAIKDMRVRGAPAIAVSAALGIAVAAANKAKDGSLKDLSAAKGFLMESLDYVATSRPTAVNLFNTIAHLKKGVEAAAAGLSNHKGAELVEAFTNMAEELYAEDVSFNEGIMKHGAKHIMVHDSKGDTHVSVMTICNTGALATARYGTALGVVRQLHYDHKLAQLYACETRPWNQGARLTVYECIQEKIPVTLICDSAAASLMRSRRIHAIIVGADRVCRNGDTANKIGTYHLAVAAKAHGVPFYVAAPSTTLDSATPSGDKVHIEERVPTEITHNMITGDRVVAEGPTLSVWNPVFDVTPAEYITGGIITEKGVFTPNARADGRLFDTEEMLK